MIFDFVLECKCKSFCNSGVCVSTSKWDSDMYIYIYIYIYIRHLNTTTVVVLQVISFERIHGFKLCQLWTYMFSMGPLMSVNRVKKSQSSVASCRPPRRGTRCYTFVPRFP